MNPKDAPLNKQHRSVTGNAVRAAVLGANDGLVSNLSLVMGVAGADLPGRSVVIAGVAGLLAGAISMALGEWISVQSTRELARRELAIEAEQFENQPDIERGELVGFLQAKGLNEREAQVLAERLMLNKHGVLDIMAHEELGINPRNLGGSAWVAASSSFVLFVIGALVPILPFMLYSGRQAIHLSLAGSSLGLMLLGAAIGWLGERNKALTAGRQVLIGLLAAAVTYYLGDLVGGLLHD